MYSVIIIINIIIINIIIIINLKSNVFRIRKEAVGKHVTFLIVLALCTHCHCTDAVANVITFNSVICFVFNNNTFNRHIQYVSLINPCSVQSMHFWFHNQFKFLPELAKVMCIIFSLIQFF